jgi:hypothetical protein
VPTAKPQWLETMVVVAMIMMILMSEEEEEEEVLLLQQPANPRRVLPAASRNGPLPICNMTWRVPTDLLDWVDDKHL